MRTGTVVIAFVSACSLAIPTGAIASIDHGQTCVGDGHKYIKGTKATVSGSKATFIGKLAVFHPCGPDDGHFTTSTQTITLTLTTTTKITVFKNEYDPSHTKTVTAANFPPAFKKNKDEPFFRYVGARSAVSTLTEKFVQ